MNEPSVSEEVEQNKQGYLLKFTVGQLVFHPKFGEGEVQHVAGSGEDAKITIKFGREIKKLIARYAKLREL